MVQAEKQNVDDHHLARATYALIFLDVCFDPAAGSSTIRTAASLAPNPASRIVVASNAGRLFMTIPVSNCWI